MKTLFLLFIITRLLTFSGFAQERKLDKANQKYEQLAYIDATEIYLDVAKSGFKSEELFKKLGNSYYFNANYQEATIWYGQLFSFVGSLSESIYYLRYSQSLKAIGRDKESQQWFDKYANKSGLINTRFKSADDYLAIIEQNSGRFTIQSLAINTPGIDFGSAFYDDKIVFASTKDTTTVYKRKSEWDGLSFLDLYEATKNEDGTLIDPVKLKGDVNTNLHESTAVFTKDGKTMYFTRSNITPKTKRTKNQHVHLKIYRAHLVNGKWKDVEDLSINSDNFSTAHPALNNDDTILYFASDRPESIGLTDLYNVTIAPDGSLGEVHNLGEEINTKGRESFPFITSDNELYFSSDGHYGLGGYDVFYAKIDENKTYTNLLNVGKPINSSYDDIAFIIDKNKGYISSNRLGGYGYDDIYSFIETKDIKELLKSKVFGVVSDRSTKEPIPNATVKVLDSNNEELFVLQTDSLGYYEAEVQYSEAYFLEARKITYSSDNAYSKREVRLREHNFELEQIIKKIKEGDDLAKTLNIIIHFDLDKSFIRRDAQVELEKLVVFLKKNPSLKVDIRSHTDSQASDSYNIALSNRRAKSTLKYLVKRGILKENLSAKGYGETQLVNDCTNGIKCTDAKHEENRRSEFIVKR
ncbi:OmpA family protein [Flavobacterium sp. W22_SRS_FK3]|uniref:OmpA family protein n=1 Tax=Flavobacterium sp. W22_SRS_FK3 TaxID=3240275 RepID=UPI003F8EB4D5